MTNQVERKPLLLAFLTGLCGNASLATLTSSYIDFSIFPIIAFVFAAQKLWQAYIDGPMEGDTPGCSLAMFFVGALGYSAFIRAEHPEIGDSLLQILICLGLSFWVAIKMGMADVPKKEESLNS